MFKDYGVSGIPHTVVVGTNGVIAWVTHPTALSATMINNVLAGKTAAPVARREEKRVAAEPSETFRILPDGSLDLVWELGPDRPRLIAFGTSTRPRDAALTDFSGLWEG